MSDPHALVLEHGGQRLTFRCDYAVLLKLEAAGDWRELLAEAIGFQKLASLIELAALFTGRTPADIIALSPPIAEVQRCVAGAWALCMEGPAGLRRYQDAVAKEAAADAGKPIAPAFVSWARQSLTTLASQFSRVSRSTSSGA